VIGHGAIGRPAVWLGAVAWSSLIVGMAAAVAIAYDVWGRGYRQKMVAMEAGGGSYLPGPVQDQPASPRSRSLIHAMNARTSPESC
jgi:hypothetical protein